LVRLGAGGARERFFNVAEVEVEEVVVVAVVVVVEVEVVESTVVGGFLGLGLEGGRRSLSSLKRVKRLGLRKRWG